MFSYDLIGKPPLKSNESVCSIEYKIRKRHYLPNFRTDPYFISIQSFIDTGKFHMHRQHSTDLFIPAFRRWTGRFPSRCGNAAHPHASGCIDGVSVVGDRGKNRSRARARDTPRLYRIESYKHLHSPGDTRLKCGGLFSYSLTLPTKLLSPDHSCTQVLNRPKVINPSLSDNTRYKTSSCWQLGKFRLFAFKKSFVSVFSKKKTRF